MPGMPVDERLIFRFLREAPRLPGARDFGVASSAVEPWPHQLRVVREVVERYPQSFLFCDEVGLGKTIEAALALRQLVISQRAQRALVLAPRGLLRQWQEELHEKAALPVPRYADGRLLDVHGRELPMPASGVPWEAPLLLAGSQLARRRERRAELLAATPWDLILVDEAHHARRRGAEGRPNRLLELLAGGAGEPGLRDRSRCLYLLTATPMQVHPLEVWDLLKLLGLGGRWGAREESFLEYFRQLRQPFEQRDWDFLLEMQDDLTEAGDAPPSQLLDPARPAAQRRAGLLALSGPRRAELDAELRRRTPLATFARRNTRRALRAYRERGLIQDTVPERRPENVWIELRPAESALYHRIEEYLSEVYQRCEAERRGLGFLMTVYRRRLTSSFAAMRKSLERRLARLRDGAAQGDLFEDLELDEPEGDIGVPAAATSEVAPPAAVPGHLFREPRTAADEAVYLEGFVRDLAALGRDSKLERLRADLGKLLAERSTALVFTQYTDTLDALRDALRQDWGARVACTSGRGGETWDGERWAPCGKEELKAAFGGGEQIRVLLCTEAASEGLNLQTCGVLINYDMPWNPMRVEQRIGRIDRIGQTHDEVWVRNYFYRDTVEAQIYRRLSDRISWFEQVVGELQPILHRVGETIETVAMLPAARRERRLEEAVAELRRQVEVRDAGAVGLETALCTVDSEAARPPQPPPVELEQLEHVLVGSEALGDRFEPDGEIAGAYHLCFGGGEHRVTFQPRVFDRHPYSVQLLTWGQPLLAQLLAGADEPPAVDQPAGIGLYRTRHPAPVSLFVRPSEAGVEEISTLEQLRRGSAGAWRPAEEGEASAMFSRQRWRVLRGMTRVEGERRRAERRAIERGARRVLARSALVELARARRPGLFEQPLPYGFGAQAVRALAARGEPFDALLAIAGQEVPAARRQDPFFTDVENRSDAELDRHRAALTGEGERLVERLRALGEAEDTARLAARPPSESGILERLWLAPEPTRDAPDAAESLRLLDAAEVRPFVDAVPLYDSLEVPASRFGDEHTIDELPQADELRNPGDYRWVALAGRARPAPGLFVARVTGESMNRRVPDGAFCLFRLAPRGTRDGKVVLAQHRDIADPELGGRLTLKVYSSEKQHAGDGSWSHHRVVLRPSSTDPRFAPIVLEDLEEGELAIIAELVEVLG